ncbi:DUF1902 domain-containing protein [Neorhizobium petrolearium]|uniref:DUF1902 domain-containing protein n=1 Tax=Neorhizobium petrolearium TaxID=515361 RepID=UPI003F179F06
MKKKFLVIAQWDEDAGMWVAISDDIPGLVTEAKSMDDLIERVMAISPELIEDNLGGAGEMDDLLEVCVQSSFSLQGTALH